MIGLIKSHRSVRRPTAAAVAVVLLAASFGAAPDRTALAQTETIVPSSNELRFPADGTVCKWENVNNNTRLARACLAEVNVNAGLAEYAFVEATPGVDPTDDTIPAEGRGLVSRWAMAEALIKVLEAADVPLPSDAENKSKNESNITYTDIGWMDPERRQRIYQLSELGRGNPELQPITEGFSDDAERRWAPTRPVLRSQMAQFFVRTLLIIEHYSPAGLSDRSLQGDWAEMKDQADRFELLTPFRDLKRSQCGNNLLEDACANIKEVTAAATLLYHLGVAYGRNPSRNSEGEYFADFYPWSINNPKYLPHSDGPTAGLVTGGQMAKFLVRLLAHTNVASDAPVADVPEEPQPGYYRPVFKPVSESPALTKVNATTLAPIDLGAQTRPPREIDLGIYATQASNPNNQATHDEYWSSFPLHGRPEEKGVSSPFQLQPGDWWWTPASVEPGNWLLKIFVEAYTFSPYEERPPYVVTLMTCNMGSSAYLRGYTQIKAHAVALGTYRLVDIGGALFGGEEPDCDLDDYNLPKPAEYTRTYPCGRQDPEYPIDFLIKLGFC